MYCCAPCMKYTKTSCLSTNGPIYTHPHWKTDWLVTEVITWFLKNQAKYSADFTPLSHNSFRVPKSMKSVILTVNPVYFHSEEFLRTSIYFIEVACIKLKDNLLPVFFKLNAYNYKFNMPHHHHDMIKCGLQLVQASTSRLYNLSHSLLSLTFKDYF